MIARHSRGSDTGVSRWGAGLEQPESLNRGSRGAGERGTIGKREAEESLCPARGEWTEEIFRVYLARIGKRKFPQAWRAMIVTW